MGLFDWFSSGSGSANNKNATPDDKACETARSRFLKCLDDQSIFDLFKHEGRARANCQEVYKDFENSCAQSRIDKFKQERAQQQK